MGGERGCKTGLGGVSEPRAGVELSRDLVAAAAALEAEAASAGGRSGDAAWPCRRLLEAATLRLDAGQPEAAEALVKRAAAALVEARSQRADANAGLPAEVSAQASASAAPTSAPLGPTLATASPLAAAGSIFPCSDALEELEVRYRELSAAAAEAQGRSAEAGGHWHALSRSRSSSRHESGIGVDAAAWEAAQLAALAAAARCALSARPGALRTRLVAALLEDRRTASPAFSHATARAARRQRLDEEAAKSEGSAVPMGVDGTEPSGGEGRASQGTTVKAGDRASESAAALAETPWVLRLLELVSRELFLGPPESVALLRASLPAYVHRPEAVEEALLEHNVLAASNVFTSTSIASLTALLGTRDDRATEAAIARAALEGRVDARIDELDGTVAFARDPASKEAWNDRVGVICGAADEAARYVKKKGYA